MEIYLLFQSTYHWNKKQILFKGNTENKRKNKKEGKATYSSFFYFSLFSGHFSPFFWKTYFF